MSAEPNISAEAEALLAKLPAISRPLIAKYFRSDFDVLQKADDSPVTIADKSVEAALRAVITQRFPDHSIIGEEEGGQASQPYCWVIDPIDGTRAFIIGKPLFGTLIALSYQGMPICGLIDMPALDETYITRGSEAFLLSGGQEKKAGNAPDSQSGKCPYRHHQPGSLYRHGLAGFSEIRRGVPLHPLWRGLL